jgi:hypothetical protein
MLQDGGHKNRKKEIMSLLKLKEKTARKRKMAQLECTPIEKNHKGCLFISFIDSLILLLSGTFQVHFSWTLIRIFGF